MTDLACRLCASPSLAHLFRKQGTDYWACRACGFRLATPRTNPNLANTLDEYEQAYLQYLAPDRADRDNFESLCAWMERFQPLAGRRLLDVGAGSGKLVRFLRERGVDASGLEPSRALFARFLAGDAAFSCATLDEVRPPAGQPADIVTAFDVIEHVVDPLGFIDAAAAVLKPGGSFFVSTPDAGSLTARLSGRRWHFYYPYHLSYFSRPTLERAAAARGFTLLDCRYRGRRRSVGYMIRYAAEFIGHRRAPVWAARFDDWHWPVNLFDTMYLCLRRRPA